jgi:DNA-binding CsgD family transcriptional regulator
VRPEEATFADWLREAPTLHLDPRIREGESVGRRQAVIVFPDDEADRMARPFVRARPGSPGRRPGGSYVAAPLAPSDDVVGLIHADYVDRDVTQLDREILAAFARAFDQIYERAVLLWRLHNERTLIAESLDHVQRVLAEVASTEIALVHRAEEAVTRRTDAGLSAVNRASATSELAAVLTGRELEVLAQMATGATNERIAQELSISRDTVKSHVTHILRKLGAENRGEAIAHYLRLTMGSL